MRFLMTGLMVVLALLLMAACGEGAVKPDDTGTVTIELTESAFTPSNIEVVAGTTVRFVLNNTGEEEHEFMIGRVVSSEVGYPDTFETDFFHGVTVDVVGEPLMVMDGEAMLTRDGKMAMEGMATEGDHDEGSSTMEGMAMDGMATEGDHDEGSSTMEGMAMDGMATEGDHDEGSSAMEGMAMEGEHGEMAMDGDHGFMISQAAGTGGTIVTIEIPEDKVGTWEIGCFIDEGTHYEDGMKGTLTVTES